MRALLPEYIHLSGNMRCLLADEFLHFGGDVRSVVAEFLIKHSVGG